MKIIVAILAAFLYLNGMIFCQVRHDVFIRDDRRDKIAIHEIGTAEIGTTEISLAEIGTAEMGITEISPAEIH